MKHTRVKVIDLRASFVLATCLPVYHLREGGTWARSASAPCRSASSSERRVWYSSFNLACSAASKLLHQGTSSMCGGEEVGGTVAPTVGPSETTLKGDVCV